jgi:hypothetical protein
VVSRRDTDEPSVKEAFWNTLRRDPADPRAIERAYWRFTRASVPRRTPFRVGRWLVVGFVAGVGAVSAATVARHVVARWTTVTPRDASNSNHEVAAPGARHASPRHRAAAAPSAVPEVPAAASADVSAPETTSPDVTSPGARPLAVPPSSAPRPVAPRAADTAPVALDPKWRRVSDALRVNDYQTAETALRELETRGAPAERESASLSLAQVLLARGRIAEARPRLERLSATARSSLVHQKATALLAGLSAPSNRSDPSATDTH